MALRLTEGTEVVSPAGCLCQLLENPVKRAYCKLLFCDVGYGSVLGGFAGTFYPFAGSICVPLWLCTCSNTTHFLFTLLSSVPLWTTNRSPYIFPLSKSTSTFPAEMG